MSWWTDVQTEPKRKSRFLVEIGSGFIIPGVKTCTKPKADVDIKEFQLINHKFRYPGIVTWQPITITFVDMAGQRPMDNQTVSTAVMLERMLKFTGYNLPTRKKGLIARSGPERDLTTTEKASTIANAFGSGLIGRGDFDNAQVLNSAELGGTNNQSIKIYHLTPDGKKSVETWILHNPQISNISWGDLSYDSEDFIEYSLEVAYDFAEMQIGNSVPKINTVNAAMVQNSGISSELEAQKSFEDVQAEIARRAAVNEALDNVQLSDTSGIGGGQDLGAVSGMGGGQLESFSTDTASIAEEYSSTNEREKKSTAFFGSYDEADLIFNQEGPGSDLADAYYEKRRKDGN